MHRYSEYLEGTSRDNKKDTEGIVGREGEAEKCVKEDNEEKI